MGGSVSDRFRDLETPDRHRRLDAVLMATVSNFENLSLPTGQELKQFAELFAPLFSQAGAETRRTAAAALSRCRRVPAAVARLIAEQPVDIAAPFLVNSSALDDAALGDIVARGDMQMARAIARRKSLSPQIVAALAATGDAVVMRSLKVRRLLPDALDADEMERVRLARENKLRDRLRALAGQRLQDDTPTADSIALPQVRPGQVARLLAFAEEREPLFFVTALADVLDCSFPLAERIMLDISGRQLAETLLALGFERDAACRALESFFPHLGRRQGQMTKSQMLLGGCDAEDAAARVILWLRADRSERSPALTPHLDDSLPGAANEAAARRREAETRWPATRRPLKRA